MNVFYAPFAAKTCGDLSGRGLYRRIVRIMRIEKMWQTLPHSFDALIQQRPEPACYVKGLWLPVGLDTG
jgi:hypothetical protein